MSSTTKSKRPLIKSTAYQRKRVYEPIKMWYQKLSQEHRSNNYCSFGQDFHLVQVRKHPVYRLIFKMVLTIPAKASRMGDYSPLPSRKIPWPKFIVNPGSYSPNRYSIGSGKQATRTPPSKGKHQFLFTPLPLQVTGINSARRRRLKCYLKFSPFFPTKSWGMGLTYCRGLLWFSCFVLRR